MRDVDIMLASLLSMDILVEAAVRREHGRNEWKLSRRTLNVVQGA